MNTNKNKHFVASNKTFAPTNKRVGAKAYTGSNDLVVHNGLVITRAERKAELNF